MRVAYLISGGFVVYCISHIICFGMKERRKMKRTTALFLAVLTALLSLSLSACANNSTDLADYDLDDYVTLCEYKGVKVPRTVMTVTDDDVADAVDEFLSQYAETVELNESDVVQMYDSLMITYSGKIKGDYEDWEDGEEFTHTLTETGTGITIGEGKFIAGFEDALIGYHIGDTVTFDITFPADYKTNEKLRNVTTTFEVGIKSGERDVKPEYTDAFIAEKTDYETIAEFEAAKRAEIREDFDEQEQLAEISAVWTYIMENSEVVRYPDAVVNAEIESTRGQFESAAKAQGVTLEVFLTQQYQMTMAEFEKALEDQCKNLVFEKMVLMMICERESITISDAEYTEGLAKYAEDNDFDTPKECEEFYGEEAIRTSLIWDKTLLFLVEKADLTDETMAES